MRHTLLFLSVLSACKADIERPSSECPCTLDYSDHPRDAALRAVVDERVSAGLPGLSAAIRTPEGVWAYAAGYANLEDQVPMNICHVHHLASVAKTWYAALALLLQEQGEIALDDRLSRYLSPEILDGVPNAEVVTLRQLMNHTSGIPDFNSDPGYITGEFNDPTSQDTPLDLVDAMRGSEPLAAPGEIYSYTDGNYVLLALALETVTGDNIARMRQEILEPLGLSATFLYERSVPEPSCICNPYWEIGGRRLENVSDLSAEYATHDIGADGVAASPLDAMLFVEALLRGDLLSEASLSEMLSVSPPSEDDEGYGYGLGIARRETPTGLLYGHTGGGVGTGAVMRASLDEELSFAAATNVGLFLGGPAAANFDETLWEDLARAAGLLE